MDSWMKHTKNKLLGIQNEQVFSCWLWKKKKKTTITDKILHRFYVNSRQVLAAHPSVLTSPCHAHQTTMTYSQTPMKSHFYKVELELRGLFRLGVSESILHLLFLLRCSCCFQGFESKKRKERLVTAMLAAQFGRLLSSSPLCYRHTEEP